jgi:predicted Fe-S protein YdhL (DUF1289 family)
VNICVIDPASGLCEGCGRSLAEIGRWPGMSADQRRQVLKDLGARLRRLRRQSRDRADDTASGLEPS